MKQYKDKEWLNGKYWNEDLSTYKIAELCNCSRTTICCWLKKLNIQIRSISEGHHLAKANHCKLSKEALEWLDGEIMGDGCLRLTSKYSARFDYGSKYLEYINYVAETLKDFGIKQSGKISKTINKRYKNIAYHYISFSYVELLPIRKRWYPNGKKIIPRDLKLTPMVLRQEIIGDGCLLHPKKQRPYIQLCTYGFPVSDVKWLVKQLNNIGFKTTRYSASNLIGISAYSTKDFLDYIGKCPVQCYQYKWNY